MLKLARHRFAVAASVVLAVGLCACHATRYDPENVPVQVVEMRRSSVCGTVEGASRITLMPDVKSVQAWRGANGFSFGNSDALESGRYILIEMGSRPTGGFSFAVSRRASFSEGQLQLTAVYLSPPPGRMVNQMVTSPCALLSLPPKIWHINRVILFDAAGTVLADTEPPDTPVPARLSIPELKSDPEE